MRDHEKDQLTGGCYFSLGCALAMTLAPPAANGGVGQRLIDASAGDDLRRRSLGGRRGDSLRPQVSMCAMVYLVLGDMAAALVGVSFGGEVAHVKLGRKGKKSVEGSLAMFCVCFAVGQLTFADLKLSEYVAFCGAVIATLTELYEPFHLNDNLTIPVFSALALQLSLGRIREKDCYQPEPRGAARRCLGARRGNILSRGNALRTTLDARRGTPPLAGARRRVTSSRDRRV